MEGEPPATVNAVAGGGVVSAGLLGAVHLLLFLAYLMLIFEH